MNNTTCSYQVTQARYMLHVYRLQDGKTAKWEAQKLLEVVVSEVQASRDNE